MRASARDMFFKEPNGGLGGRVDLNNRDREIEKEVDPVLNIAQNVKNISSLTKELEGTYVGFASLPNQVYRKAVKKGFDFNLMVVGQCYIFNFLISYS